MRRPLIALSAAGLIVLAAAVGFGGRAVIAGLPAAGLESTREQTTAATSDMAPSTKAEAPPAGEADPSGLERLAARKPLSQLSLALPPKPKAPAEWEATVLFGAVAQGAGLIEAKGYTVAIAGVKPLDVQETCRYEGKDWECGVRARTAFRAFLRGRAPSCVVPPEPDRTVIAAPCMMGKQDVAKWLVSNGWAHAAEGSPLVEEENKARKAKRGIFGRPPSTTGLPALPLSDPPIEATVRDTGSFEILGTTEDEGSPSVMQLTPPVAQPEPSQ